MTIPSDKPETTLKAQLRQMETGMKKTMVSRETIPLRWVTDRGLCLMAGADTLSLYRRLAGATLPGVVELVPADGMLLAVLAPGAAHPPQLEDILNSVCREEGAGTIREHRIPVRFDGEDLPAAAERTGLGVDGLVKRLCSLTLQVKFLGFQPGFAYLEGLPPELHLPRRASPRKKVAAGSVALGGAYCGIYSVSGPGGWHLLGSTGMPMFDPGANPPALLQPGDKVRLVAA